MKNILKALAAFQQEVPTIHKGTEGYNYSYADLPAIFDVIKPLLEKNGLSFYQCLEGHSLKTIVYHIETGEKIESTVDIPQDVKLNKMNDFQVLGSGITYLRRYSLSCILGLITDKDVDASNKKIDEPSPSVIDEPKELPLLNSSHQYWNTIAKKLAKGTLLTTVKESFKIEPQSEAELLELAANYTNENAKKQ